MLIVVVCLFVLIISAMLTVWFLGAVKAFVEEGDFVYFILAVLFFFILMLVIETFEGGL